MKGVAVTFMFIMIITVSLISILVGWTVMNTFSFFEANEINSVKKELANCNDKIIETARTGLTNKCIFPIDRGELRVSKDGLNYTIISSAAICDEHPLVLIDEEKHIWQQCYVSGKNRILQLFWMYPSEIEIEGQNLSGNVTTGNSNVGNINFNNPTSFRTLTLFIQFEIQGQEGVEVVSKTGKTIVISRVGLTAEEVTLSINVM